SVILYSNQSYYLPYLHIIILLQLKLKAALEEMKGELAHIKDEHWIYDMSSCSPKLAVRGRFGEKIFYPKNNKETLIFDCNFFLLFLTLGLLLLGLDAKISVNKPRHLDLS
ncbi:hypothetical protein ACJX0J_021894, partial [Zea mays]